MSEILHTWELGVQQGKYQERERIIEALTKEYGEDYVDMGVVGQILRLIKVDE
jgi:hypothetical protein